MKKTKAKPRYNLPLCDNCNKPAIYNIQQVWHLYDIDKKGIYSENDSWEGNENDHYCQKHYDKEIGN